MTRRDPTRIGPIERGGTDDEIVGSSTARSARLVAGLTAVSRATGFARIVVVGAVLGRTVLGDTYQTANSIPNVVFELLAAGVLQSALLPHLVRTERELGADGARAFLDRLLAVVLVGLAAVVAVGMVGAPLVMRAFSAASLGAVERSDKIALGAAMLVVFLPQLLFYATGAVATAALNSRLRFGAAAAAPIVNNVVVIGAYAWFDRLRHGRAPSLRLSGGEFAVLSGGTTVAVVAFTLVPVVAARRAGWPIRPRLRVPSIPLAAMLTVGRWAAAQVALVQVIQIAVLVVANRVAGATTTYTLASGAFLVPFAILAAPIATAVGPRLARAVDAGDLAGAHGGLRWAVRTAAMWLAGAGALLALGAWPVARVVARGDAARGDLAPLAHALVVFGVGLLGYGVFNVLARSGFALGAGRDVAWATAVAAGVAVVGIVVASILMNPAERPAAVALGLVVGYSAGGLVLHRSLRSRFGTARAGR